MSAVNTERWLAGCPMQPEYGLQNYSCIYVEPPKYFSYIPQTWRHLQICCINLFLIFLIFCKLKSMRNSIFNFSFLMIQSIITLLQWTGDIAELPLLPWLSWIHSGAGVYIAVKNEPTVRKNVTKARNGQKLLGILRVKKTALSIK